MASDADEEPDAAWKRLPKSEEEPSSALTAWERNATNWRESDVAEILICNLRSFLPPGGGITNKEQKPGLFSRSSRRQLF
jgi:hypothetical protein